MPLAVGSLRDTLKRTSIGLSFTSNFSLLSRFGNSGGATDDAQQQQEASARTSVELAGDNDDEDENAHDHDQYRLRATSNSSNVDEPNSMRSSRGDGSNGYMNSPSYPVANAASSYVEPPEPPLPPPGGLQEAAAKNVQGKMQDIMETQHVVRVCDEDESIESRVFLSRSALFSDRLVVFLSDSDSRFGGIWSAKLCVRSGSEGGGIYKGSLGSMLPYISKAKEDKLGVIMFDDVFEGAVTDTGEIDMDKAVKRFMTGWRYHALTNRASHVFVVAYRDGGSLLLEALRAHVDEMQRVLSGVAFIQSTHSVSSADPYLVRKLVAQWCVQYIGSQEPFLARIRPQETLAGCVCVSAGCDDSEVTVLQSVVDAVFAGFKARWSGFRVKNVNSGMEKFCYLCKQPFNMRRWRRHCRTCQHAVCERCSLMETTRTEGQVRFCSMCHALPSLINWSRPRAVRIGEKESVFSGSARAGKLSVNDFELVSVIGRGACGKVLMVQKKEGNDAGRVYAMKVLKKDWVMNKDLVTQTMAERRILQEANHPYIVQLKYAFQNQDKLYMVMDYYSGGSLRQVLRRRGRFSIKRSRFYLGQVLLAISHLHALNILYRDLKLENIVISDDGNVACTDFGLSKEEMDDNERTSSFVGTCEYLAPELILKEGYGKPVDWWAFGILAFEMIQGDSPFRHQVPTILFDKILREEPLFTDRFTPESIDLISKLLNKNPSLRLGCGLEGVEEIKRHPFFEDMDWEGLLNKTVEVPRPPHRLEEVTDESHVNRAIAKMRDDREEMMPDSPVSMPSSPSEETHFDRFSYQGMDDWTPAMANMVLDEDGGDLLEPIQDDENEEDEDSSRSSKFSSLPKDEEVLNCVDEDPGTPQEAVQPGTPIQIESLLSSTPEFGSPVLPPTPTTLREVESSSSSPKPHRVMDIQAVDEVDADEDTPDSVDDQPRESNEGPAVVMRETISPVSYAI